MKNLIFALVAILSASLAVAAPNSEMMKTILEKQKDCGRFVRADNSAFYLGFGVYRTHFEEPRQPIPGAVRVVSLTDGEDYTLNTADAAIDLVTEQNHAFVLTFSSIEEWDLATRTRVGTYQTYAYPRVMELQMHAQAFARYKNKMIIAHGRLGLSFFDLGSKRQTNQFRILQSQLPLESMATGVTVQGKYAYVVVDNFSLVSPPSKAPFRGVIVVDMDSESVVAQLDGMDPFVTSVTADSNVLIASFDGQPIWKYSLSSLQGRSMPEPIIRIWKFPVPGHPAGSAMMDDKYYYTCYSKAPEHPGDNGGMYKSVPMALDRRVLILE
jgi:hypothetical protein